MYLFVLPAVAYLLLFNYGPMYGVQIAFKDFKSYSGIVGSEYVGLKHIIRMFEMKAFGSMVRNTLTLSIYSLLAGFPLPIILALGLNSCKYNRYKKVVQTVTYAPHFISVVVIVGMLNIFFSPSTGIVKNVLQQFGLIENTLYVLMDADAFPHLYVWSGVWTQIGWNSIIYLGALSGVDQSLHEAAIVEGASKRQRIWYVDVPSILPTIIVLLILNCGSIMSVGFEKAFLMQNSMNSEKSEIISTYVYKIGIQDGQWSFSTAIGLFNSVINFVILTSVNWISRRVGETSLW